MIRFLSLFLIIEFITSWDLQLGSCKRIHDDIIFGRLLFERCIKNSMYLLRCQFNFCLRYSMVYALHGFPLQEGGCGAAFIRPEEGKET